MAEELSKGLGQPVIVENRPGQSAIIGTQLVKAAGYNPANDFTGVSLVCRIPQLLVVNANHPARTLPQLVAMAKANRARCPMAARATAPPATSRRRCSCA